MKRAFYLVLLVLLIVPPLAAGAGLPTSSPVGLNAAVHTIRANDAILRMARDTGFAWVVQLLEWRELEPLPGEYLWEYADWLVRACEYYDLQLAVRLDHPPEWALSPDDAGPPVDPDTYADFVGRVAARYRGRIGAYIVWNEPNLSSEWADRSPDPAGYVTLLRAAGTAIRAADPSARVVSAGLAPTNEVGDMALDDRVFLREMYAAGAKGDFNVLGAHPYGFAYPPTDPAGAHDGLNFARLADLRQIMVEAGDAETPVWATEMGWTTAPFPPQRAWQQVTEQQQAEYMVAAFDLASAEWPWLEMLTVWNLSAGLPADDEKRGYSIVTDDYQPKPAYRALQSMLSTLSASAQANERAIPGVVEILAPDVVVRLGDVDTFYPHWSWLHCAATPCREWTGHFYVSDPGQCSWRLNVEIMQVEEHGNIVRINGHALAPPALPLRAKPDFASVWTTTEMMVPSGILRRGANLIEMHVSPRLPVYQGQTARFESLQFRNVSLVPLEP